MILILLVEFFVVQKQTTELIRPINELDLESPLKDVCYEELRPLLVRVDQQNRQIARQVEELKAAEEMRKEFSANVSHELKTPLMSISGYAELMMNGMVPEEHVADFSGRIYHEAHRLTNLVTDIIQLSRLDEKNSNLPFEIVAFAGAEYFERMKERGLYSTDTEEIARRVRRYDIEGIYEHPLR